MPSIHRCWILIPTEQAVLPPCHRRTSRGPEGQTALPKKPDPTVALMIADRFGAAPCECAFIGDSDVDVKTAKNAGMTSVACSWGYRPVCELADADVIIDRAEELLNIFE